MLIVPTRRITTLHTMRSHDFALCTHARRVMLSCASCASQLCDEFGLECRGALYLLDGAQVHGVDAGQHIVHDILQVHHLRT